ncbi:hypothetical protein BGZ70_006061 [Mortierella alpina]|uniref:SDE2-like domain-containing protein n=1 Tax=Mortierella alpina TaxID=64518 RepID=A0A9P6J8K7_MORAP|nr:hypothetical protein BGZ70_006061 [Mortierella alpina]
MEAIVSVFGSNPVAITFPESSSPSLLDLKQQLFDRFQIPCDEQRIQTAGGLPLLAAGGLDQDDEHILLFDDVYNTNSNSSNHSHSQDSLQEQESHDETQAMQQIKYFSLSLRMNGGKGGFGSMLRAQGGRMSSQKTTNTDACRDLSGRRIKTVNDAKKMAEYLKSEPEREKAKRENLKRKIEEKLELADRPTRKHRFEDAKFFDESEEQVEEVKSAVAAAIKESMKAGAAGVDQKGKRKAKEVAVEKKKAPAKSLGMWDDMSDYESSEGEDEGQEGDEEEDEEDEEEEEEDEEEAKVPSVGSSSSSSSSSLPTKARSSGSKAK